MENQFTQQTTMQEVETHYPFARSLLHSKFHVGGCASCGYEANETIEQVSQKHKKDGSAMLEALNQGWLDMQKAEIMVDQFAEMKMRKAKMLIIDVREDWEYELANIPNSYLLTETNFEETVESAKKVECVIVVCHHGLRSMNATLYLRENGVTNARSLQGGIDLYSSKIDPSIPRY